MTKKCKGCDAVKPRDEFYDHAFNTDGKESVCKACRKKRLRDKYVRKREMK